MKLSRSVLRPAGLALACLSTTALAQVEQRPIVITGSVTPRTLGSEIAASSVLTRADLERTGATDLVTALNLLGSALVEQQGGPGTAAAVRLRGADSRDTLVLIDGVPQTDVTTGASTISQLPVDLIERIEVVRGNLSALYGANATGGVIQVFTRRGTPGWQAHVALRAGSRNTAASSASLAGGTNALRARVTLGIERSGGFSAADPALAATANPDDDGHRQRHAALAVDATPAAGHDLGLDLRVVRGTTEYDNPGAAPFASSTDVHQQSLLQRGATLRGRHRLGDAWSIAWRAGEADEIREDLGGFGNVLHNRLAALDANHVLAPGWTLQLGAERLSQSTDNATYTRNKRRTDVLRAGVQHDAAWGSLQANLRRDDTSDFGVANTGLLGGTWRFAPRWRAFASASTSFTPPTLDFLFFDCTPFGFVCSNPDLRPERSRNADLGVQWEDADTLLRATLFDVRYRDKIAADPLLNFLPNNVARARNRGLELAVRHVFGAWSVAGEAVFHNPVDAATGERLRRRTRQQFALRLDHDAGAWGAGAQLRHVGNRPDTTPDTFTPVTLASYTVLDAAARWNVAPQWTLQATAENLFDRAYQPTAHYSGRPRGVFVSLAWQSRP